MIYLTHSQVQVNHVSIRKELKAMEDYRRFEPLGNEEEMKGFKTLCEEKNLSRHDLYVILKALRVRPEFVNSPELFQ